MIESYNAGFFFRSYVAKSISNCIMNNFKGKLRLTQVLRKSPNYANKDRSSDCKFDEICDGSKGNIVWNYNFKKRETGYIIFRIQSRKYKTWAFSSALRKRQPEAANIIGSESGYEVGSDYVVGSAKWRRLRNFDFEKFYFY